MTRVAFALILVVIAIAVFSAGLLVGVLFSWDVLIAEIGDISTVWFFVGAVSIVGALAIVIAITGLNDLCDGIALMENLTQRHVDPDDDEHGRLER